MKNRPQIHSAKCIHCNTIFQTKVGKMCNTCANKRKKITIGKSKKQAINIAPHRSK